MIVIRTAQVADAAALRAIYGPYVMKTTITFDLEVPTVADFEQKIVRIKKRYPFLVAEENSVIVGYAYASTYYD